MGLQGNRQCKTMEAQPNEADKSFCGAFCPRSMSGVVAEIGPAQHTATKGCVERANKTTRRSKPNKLAADMWIFEVPGLQDNG